LSSSEQGTAVYRAAPGAV